MKGRFLSLIMALIVVMVLVSCKEGTTETESNTQTSAAVNIESFTTDSDIFENEYFRCEYNSELFSFYDNPNETGDYFNIKSSSIPDVPKEQYNTAFSMFRNTVLNSSNFTSGDGVERGLKDFAMDLLNSHGTEIFDYQFNSNVGLGEVSFVNEDGSHCYLKLLATNNSYAMLVLLRTCDYTTDINNQLKSVYDSATLSNEYLLKCETMDADFFAKINKEEYYSYYHTGSYDALYKMTTDYINESNPPQTDNAYALKSILDPVMEVWKDVSIELDSFSEEAKFYYKNISEISDTVHFVPYATNKEKNIYVIAGFKNNDWLFSDTLEIKCGNEMIQLTSPLNESRDVLGGKTVSEIYRYEFDAELIDQFRLADKHEIRFSNSDDAKKLDFVLSPEEEKAFNVISRFWNIRNQIDDLAFNFYDNIIQY